MSIIEGSAAAVAVGIDAAVVANHHVVVRRPEAGRPGTVVEDFVVSPTLAGMERLTKRLVAWPGAVAVAEPTSMTWLPLSIALGDAGVELSLVGNRHSARLRSKNSLARDSTAASIGTDLVLAGQRRRRLRHRAYTVAGASSTWSSACSTRLHLLTLDLAERPAAGPWGPARGAVAAGSCGGGGSGLLGADRPPGTPPSHRGPV